MRKEETLNLHLLLRQTKLCSKVQFGIYNPTVLVQIFDEDCYLLWVFFSVAEELGLQVGLMFKKINISDTRIFFITAISTLKRDPNFTDHCCLQLPEFFGVSEIFKRN